MDRARKDWGSLLTQEGEGGARGAAAPSAEEMPASSRDPKLSFSILPLAENAYPWVSGEEEGIGADEGGVKLA